MFYFFNHSLSFSYILIFVIAYVMALSIAMSFHEFAHAIAAKSQGDYTATVLGRCTLAPLSHIDLKGLLFLLFFGFGWAKPVPIDDRNFKNGKKSKFLVSIAGILMNLILGILFLFILCAIQRFVPQILDGIYGNLLYVFLNLSVSLNFSFMMFNLLPIYPLDGFRILETVTKYDNKFVEWLRQYSFIIYLVIILTSAYYFLYNLVVGSLIRGLIKLFTFILGA